jgi:type I restriction enzyme S subunit
MFGDPVTNPKGWEVKYLKENIVHANNGLSRRRKDAENIGDIVLRLQDIHYDGIRLYKDLNRINLDSKEKSRYKVDVGDILFVRVNGNPDYVGRSAVFLGHSEDVYHNDHIIRIKLSEKYNTEFLTYCFNQKGGRKLISKYIKTSAGQHTISQGGIEKLGFYQPPVSLQNKFVELQRKVLNIPHDDKGVGLLFESLSQKAFSGSL